MDLTADVAVCWKGDRASRVTSDSASRPFAGGTIVEKEQVD
jgi:hypothetical protein